MNNRYFHIWQAVLLLCLMMLTGQNALAQKMTVAGTVYDASGEALMGATVREAGTANGVATDMDGKFTLTCDQSSQLEISYVGYLTKKVKAGKDIKVVLEEDAKMLAETVVVGVGYGTMRKNDLTGSIASVNAKDLKHGVITSAEQMLQGKVAGLSVVQASGSPENGASIRLRGGTSLSASNSPLIVVDGIPGVDMNSVQPSEIQSIDVLKDASAAAIMVAVVPMVSSSLRQTVRAVMPRVLMCSTMDMWLWPVRPSTSIYYLPTSGVDLYARTISLMPKIMVLILTGRKN